MRKWAERSRRQERDQPSAAPYPCKRTLTSFVLALVLGVQNASPCRYLGCGLGRPPKNGRREVEDDGVPAGDEADELAVVAAAPAAATPGAGRGKSMMRAMSGSRLAAVGKGSGIEDEGMNEGSRLRWGGWWG